jgi:hypothetical protein
MIGFLATIAGMIPGIAKIVEALTNSYFNAKVTMATARIGGDVAVARELVIASARSEATGVERLKVISASWPLILLVCGFALPWIIYEWKVVVWDNVFAYYTHGRTEVIGGQVGDWAVTIIASIFGSSTVLAAGHIYFNRNKTGE